MRIGIYLENYDAGGVETVIANTVANWPNPNDEFILVANREADGVQIILKERLPHGFISVPTEIISLPVLHARHPRYRTLIRGVGYYGRYFLILVNALRLKRLFAGLKLDRLLIHNGGYPGAFSAVSALIAARVCGMEQPVFIVHNLPQEIHFLQRPFDFIYDFLVQRYSRAVCVSHKAALKLREVRAFKKLPIVVHNGVDEQTACPQLSTRAISGRFNIASVGRLSSEKGHRYLLDALKRLKESAAYLDFLLHVFGKGTPRQEAELTQAVQDRNLEKHVVFHGFVREMPQAIAGFDALVLASYEVESLPMVILEAMSLSIPVVATDIGGVCEIIENGVSGLVVPIQDAQALSSAILQLMCDSELKTQIGENGRKRFHSEFTAKKMALRYHEIVYCQ